MYLFNCAYNRMEFLVMDKLCKITPKKFELNKKENIQMFYMLFNSLYINLYIKHGYKLNKMHFFSKPNRIKEPKTRGSERLQSQPVHHQKNTTEKPLQQIHKNSQN